MPWKSLSSAIRSPRTSPPTENSSGMMYSRASVMAMPRRMVKNAAPRTASSDAPADQANPANIGLDDMLGCSAAAAGAVVVDSYPLFAGRTFELTHMGEGFNVHPNDDGYSVIAAAHRNADAAS